MEIGEIKKITDAIITEAAKVVISSEEVVTKMLVTIMAGGHVLLEDQPGSGKTTLAKTLAGLLGIKNKRVQFTPDLMPSDVTGLNVYNQKTGAFSLIKGPVFTNLLLADEINRATPRAQASLLEAMEEQQVTIDGETLALARPFFVIATENPMETTGTYPLPEAQIDRFMMKLSMGALDEAAKLKVIEAFMDETCVLTQEPLCSAEQLVQMQNEVKKVMVHPCIREYIVHLLAECSNQEEKRPLSTRAMLALVRAAQCYAAMQGRNYVIPDDVKYLAPSVLAHRISLYGNRKKNTDWIEAVLQRVAVPVEDWNA